MAVRSATPRSSGSGVCRRVRVGRLAALWVLFTGLALVPSLRAQTIQTPVALDAPTAEASEPSIAAAPDGSPGCAWVSRDAGEWRIVLRERLTTGTWSEPVSFPSPPGSRPGAPFLLYDKHGNPRLLWRDGPTGHRQIAFASRFAGVWLRSAPLSDGPVYEFAEPTAAFDAQGRFHAAWTEGLGSFQQIAAATIDTRGSLLRHTLTEGQPESLNLYPMVIGGGDAIVLWHSERFDEGQARFVVDSRQYNPAEDRWLGNDLPLHLSELPTNRLPIFIGTGADLVSAVWYDPENGHDRIFFGLAGQTTLGAGMIVDENAGGQNSQPAGAFTKSGLPVVCWRGENQNGPAIFVRKYGVDSWLPPAILAGGDPPAPSRPRVAAGDRDAHVAWTSDPGAGGTGNLYVSTVRWDEE